MEEAASSSIENKANSSEAISSAVSRQLIINDSSDLSRGRVSPSTDLAVSEEASSPPITSHSTESDSPEHRKSTNRGSLVLSDYTSDSIIASSSNEVPDENTTTELSEVTNNQCVPSSTDSSIDEMWLADSEYSDSLREFREAFNCAVGTVLDIVKNRICWMCASPSNTGERDLEELLRPLPPLVALALKDAAVLKAAEKGEGHALVHLLAIGARGDGTDCEKRNALHLACIGGWDNCVYVLIDYKAISRTRGRMTTRSWDPKTDFDAVDVYSKTPLDYAKEKSSNSTCAFYIERAIEHQYNKRVRKVKKKS